MLDNRKSIFNYCSREFSDCYRWNRNSLHIGVGTVGFRKIERVSVANIYLGQLKLVATRTRKAAGLHRTKFCRFPTRWENRSWCTLVKYEDTSCHPYACQSDFDYPISRRQFCPSIPYRHVGVRHMYRWCIVATF